MEKTERNNRASDYANIRNMKELQYQRRLLSSRIDHQEITVMYKLRCLWDFVSPSNLMDLGFKAIATHNPSFNIFYRAFSFVKDFLRSRRR